MRSGQQAGFCHPLPGSRPAPTPRTVPVILFLEVKGTGPGCLVARAGRPSLALTTRGKAGCCWQRASESLPRGSPAVWPAACSLTSQEPQFPHAHEGDTKSTWREWRQPCGWRIWHRGLALSSTSNRVAIVIIILPPSFSSGPGKGWRDELKRHSDVSAARRECLSNQHKRQRQVINTPPAPPALGFSIPVLRWRLAGRGCGIGGWGLETEFSVGAVGPFSRQTPSTCSLGSGKVWNSCRNWALGSWILSPLRTQHCSSRNAMPNWGKAPQ